MSKHQVVRTIRHEITQLNKEIDLRIIKGLSYRRESFRHKMLISQLGRLTRRESMFGRVFSFAF